MRKNKFTFHHKTEYKENKKTLKMSYTYPTNWATMTKKEKEKFAQTSITLDMVEIAQEYVPDLFGKFSKTKTASVIKNLGKRSR